MRYTTSTIKGHGRGKFLGFPTFNLTIPTNFRLKQGIWASHVWLSGHDQPYQGALHYGPVPVFDQLEPSLEIFLLDYDSDDPVDQLTFEPLHYLRPVKNFPTQEDLVAQIEQDVAQVRYLLSPNQS